MDLTYSTGEFFDTSGFDHDPDVFNVGKTKTMELKCTGSNGNWLGNSTSKRPDFYTMIKWDGLNRFYMGLLWLDEDEWKPSKSKDFKGTTFSKYQLWDRLDRIDLMGSLEIKEYKLNGEPMVRPRVKIITEEVDDSLVSEEWLRSFLHTQEGQCPYCDKISLSAASSRFVCSAVPTVILSLSSSPG